MATNFTEHEIHQISQMTSLHAIRLYQLLVQYLSASTRVVEIDWLRDVLKIDAGEYEQFKDFKRYVVDKAAEQINKYSNINIEYTQRKSGRKTTHFIFSIKEKNNPKPATKKSTKAALDELIKAHARPGETYDAAKTRILREADKPAKAAKT